MSNGKHEIDARRIRRVLQLLDAHRTIAVVTPTDLDLLEPAPEIFDPPVDEGDWRPLGEDRHWGGEQQWTHFRATFAIPDHWTDGPYELRIEPEPHYLGIARDDNTPAGPEGQTFIDGHPVGGIDHRHRAIRHAFKPGKTHDVRLVFFAGRCACQHRMGTFAIARIDPAVERLFHDLRVAVDLVDHCDPMLPAHAQWRAAVMAAVEALDLRGVENPLAPEPTHDPEGTLLRQSIPAAQQAFEEHRDQIDDAPRAMEQCVGHAHIDLAWLWPHTLTRHKNTRTFATQDRLLNQYPDWVFQQSSPQAYAWLAEDDPALFKKVRKWIDAGRWEADGATWVEMDTNVTGGESLVRQLLYGKAFFQDELGVESRMLWVPDVFGYSAALPQLLARAGVDMFVTSKISWSLENEFPHDTFRWRGLDGSEVIVHYITTPETIHNQDIIPDWRRTYNGRMTVPEVRENARTYKQRALGLPSLNSFGWGDGGGGPTEQMLETAERLADWPLPADMPRLRHGKAYDLYPEIDSKRDRLPIWDGELYLEYHRGTYTSHGWLKRANRRNEARLHDLEWLACLAERAGYEFEKEPVDGMWRDLMFCQFHDILPGTSVHEVYEQVAPMQKRIADTAETMIDAAATCLADRIDIGDRGKPVVLFNTLGWERSDPIRLPDGQWVDGVTIPAGGWSVIDVAGPEVRDAPGSLSVSEDGRAMANRWWKLQIDEEGRLGELYDRTRQRQIFAPGEAGNLWQIYSDHPHHYDAWEVDPGTYDREPLPGPVLRNITVAERSRVRIAVDLVWELPPSVEQTQREATTIRQRIAMYGKHPRIDFETVIDWHEHHQLLKVAFPLDVRAKQATYEVQFGHVQRPTHRNTAWDRAKFEVCAQRWIDLSEHGFGVALLNDCKYGFDVHENVMRMTCLKSPQAPDRLADQGRHEFTYALLSHGGDWRAAGIPQAAAELNQPPRIVTVDTAANGARGNRDDAPDRDLPAEQPFFHVDTAGVILDTLKPAEDGKGWIARLYEAFGGKRTATLALDPSVKRVIPTNLLEQTDAWREEPEVEAEGVTLTFEPHEIRTFRLSV